ncbi:hypothetical protein TNCV_1962061 [Trichonephila clavipes]|nr:hypothetical protein TNCV_1962061 [Trichonephila clavipes]
MAKYTVRRRYRRRNARPNYRRCTGGSRYRYRKHSYRRGPVRRRAMTMAGNCVKFTTKNNVNTFIMWPQDTLADKVPQISWTVIPLSIDGLVHSNRQFLRNLTDYVHIKFNYIAFKVTDVCHIGHDIVEQMGSGGSPQYIAPGVNAFLGTVPLNVNWDVEQDFSNIHGQKGNVDLEGFAQHPSTKTIRPGDKKNNI